MKARIIGIKSKDEFFRDTRGFLAELDRGGKAKKTPGVYFDSLETLRRVLTPKRLEIIRVIKKDNPISIYALAKRLGRNLKNVTQDLEYLENAGLVELKKSVSGRGLKPVADYDRIHFEIAV
ncbi:MAG: HTH domain-containing protein [Nitrospinae bacterium]|nr:HTH domain-containing protein [Nitrospinota bacterium]